MKLYKSDLLKIGHTAYSNGKGTVIVTHPETVDIENILLRNILELFGDYHILKQEVSWDGNSYLSTDLPYSVYCDIGEEE